MSDLKPGWLSRDVARASARVREWKGESMTDDLVLEQPWRCYHCGFIATNDAEAKAHFGDSDAEPAACRGRWMDFHAVRAENAELRTRIAQLEADNAALSADRDLWRTAHDAQQAHYHAAIEDATARVLRLEGALQELISASDDGIPPFKFGVGDARYDLWESRHESALRIAREMLGNA